MDCVTAMQQPTEKNDAPEQKIEFSMFNDYDDLWQMFRAVIANSTWGSADFGGPVWILDFSLENLKKLFPDNPLLKFMEQQRALGSDSYGLSHSEWLCKFCDWFCWRAKAFVEWQGLGNVLIKNEARTHGSFSQRFYFYGYGIFLDILRSLVGGRLDTWSDYSLERRDFSMREAKQIKQLTFYTSWNSEGIVRRFPCDYGSGFHYYKTHPTFGQCYRLEHFSLTKGYVVSETQPEKFITLIVNDLMEAKAQGYGNQADKNGNTCPYPQLKYDHYVDANWPCNHHFRETVDVFHWQRDDGYIEKIQIDLPQISEQNREFWHRDFPMKQNWQTLE
ncbi:MAG: hypothetical protein IJ218_02085 [Alphaproteobacteria bacterium]|nr:hypothetical protein [Alphaproteobacteria bacterium]